MRRVMGEYNIEDPGKPEGGVDDHDGIVRPVAFECQGIAEAEVTRSSLEEGKVHDKIPKCCVVLFLRDI